PSLPTVSPQPPCRPGRGRGQAWASCAASAAANLRRSTSRTACPCSCWSSAPPCRPQRSCLHVSPNW
ncbi:Phosphoglucan water dikinase chloroplastic, partial [Dissostichus eleginoides]